MNAFVHRMLRLLTAVEFLLVSFRCFSFIRDINRKLNFSTKTETHLNRSTNWFFLRHRKVKILNKTLSKRKQNIHTHDDDNDDDVDDIDDIFNASSFYAKTKTLTNGKGTMIEFHYFLSFFYRIKYTQHSAAEISTEMRANVWIVPCCFCESRLVDVVANLFWVELSFFFFPSSFRLCGCFFCFWYLFFFWFACSLLTDCVLFRSIILCIVLCMVFSRAFLFALCTVICHFNFVFFGTNTHISTHIDTMSTHARTHTHTNREEIFATITTAAYCYCCFFIFSTRTHTCTCFFSSFFILCVHESSVVLLHACLIFAWSNVYLCVTPNHLK